MLLPLCLSLIDDNENICKFEQIYHEYHNIIYNIAFGITKNHHDAEDALQSSLFSIAKNIETIKTDNVLLTKSYIYKIVKNAAIDVLRRKKIFINIDSLLSITSDSDIYDSIEGDEQYKSIVKHIMSMPSVYKDVLFLHFVKEMSTKQIATSLKRSHSAVKQQLARGTKKLRTILREAGLHD